MPLCDSTFHTPWYLRSGHIQSMAPTLFRRVPPVAFTQERLELLDGDFLDLDWFDGGFSRLAIISHGLEGSSKSGYVQGMAHALLSDGWNVLAWNMRGCGGTRNRLLRWYHSGESADLAAVIEHAHRRYPLPVALIGFSIGGNITLKYLGERKGELPDYIRCAVTFSVPTDLGSSADTLARKTNSVYMRYLLSPLFNRIEEKAHRFPEAFELRGLRSIRTFHEFDRRYTAPIHGFASAEEYWRLSSSGRVISDIEVPTLLVNAANDPFLSPACFPYQIADQNPHFHFEVPSSGGHVGFLSSLNLRSTWAEERALAFLKRWP